MDSIPGVTNNYSPYIQEKDPCMEVLSRNFSFGPIQQRNLYKDNFSHQDSGHPMMISPNSKLDEGVIPEDSNTPNFLKKIDPSEDEYASHGHSLLHKRRLFQPDPSGMAPPFPQVNSSQVCCHRCPDCNKKKPQNVNIFLNLNSQPDWKPYQDSAAPSQSYFDIQKKKKG